MRSTPQESLQEWRSNTKQSRSRKSRELLKEEITSTGALLQPHGSGSAIRRSRRTRFRLAQDKSGVDALVIPWRNGCSPSSSRTDKAQVASNAFLGPPGSAYLTSCHRASPSPVLFHSAAGAPAERTMRVQAFDTRFAGC